MKIHFFRYAHGEEKIISHDVVQSIFLFIMKDEECVLCEQTHIILLPTFIFHIKGLTLWFWWMMFRHWLMSLVDVIIVDPTQIDLVLQIILFRALVATIVI